MSGTATTELAANEEWNAYRLKVESLADEAETLLSAITFMGFIDAHPGEAWTLATMASQKLEEIANLPTIGS